MKIPEVLVIAALSLVTIVSPAFSQSGSLDTSFGSGGIVAANVPGSGRAIIRKIALQTDSKIVALLDDTDQANSFKLVIGRFNPDGSVDTSFGTGGFVYSQWPTGGSPNPRSIAVQDDGKIVACGMAQLGRNALAARFERYNSDGSIDNSFGTTGVVAVNITGPNTMAIQQDGKILAMNQDGKLMRLNSNGSLDSTFGSGGIASPKLTLVPWPNGLFVLPSGRIIATGRTTVGNSGQFTVARYNSNGSLDDGTKSDATPGDQFGSAGKAVISFPGYTGGQGYETKLDSVGRLVSVGVAGTQNNAIGLARLSASGQVDLSFGGTGRVVFTDNGGTPQASALGIQNDGRIIVIGQYFQNGGHDAMLLRFNNSGSIDSFDVGQFVRTDTFGDNEYAYDGAIHLDPLCGCERLLWTGATYTQNGVGTPLMLRFVL